MSPGERTEAGPGGPPGQPGDRAGDDSAGDDSAGVVPPAESVSVVVPAYNAAATIGDALDSVRAQTSPPMETVVVDDGSTDGTAERVAERFPEVRLLRQPNAGPSAARNAGLAVAAGRWLAWLDADDRWHPAKLAAQLEVVRADPRVVLVATDWVRWPGRDAAPPARVPRTVLSGRDLLVLNRFQTSTALLRTDVARRLGGFDPQLDGAEDWDMWLRAAGVGPVVKLDWPYVTYRDVDTGYSKDLGRVYRTMCRMLERERSRSTLPRAELGRLLAWHHLRFAVGFALAHDPRGAADALAGLRRQGVARFAAPATARLLLPFLLGRLGRRLPLAARRG